MKRPGELLSSFDRSWDDFSGAWKKARAKASEKSIHDLRVSTRRLIATLELVRALAKRSEIDEMHRNFKKVLKRMGPLRDIQVQLEGVSRLSASGLIGDFKKMLERRERREIDKVRSELKRERKRHLSGNVKDVRAEFTGLYESLGIEKFRIAVERVLTLRRTEFLKAERQFHKLQPLNDEALHEMRIALKKLRYVVEASQPVLGASAKQSAKQMQAFQQLLGDARDVEMLRAVLETWAAKRGKKMAVVPALDSLAEKRALLLKRIMESSLEIEELLKVKAMKPAAEKTHVAGGTVVVTDKTPVGTIS
jgi:CHAD domain-containing protein